MRKIVTSPKTFEDFEVWQEAHQWVLWVDKFAESFPKKEMHGLISQLCRAAISIPANIAVGYKKRGKAGKAYYYNIAQGSIEQCRYYLNLVEDLGYGDTDRLKAGLEEISRLLKPYLKTVAGKSSPQRRIHA